MILEAYYAGHADRPAVVATAAELAAVLDAVAALEGPQIVQLWVDGDKTKPNLMVGLHGDRGILRYADADQAFCSSGGEFSLPEWGEVIYYLATGEFEFPDDAELPDKDIRGAAFTFFASGGARPASVAWAEE